MRKDYVTQSDGAYRITGTRVSLDSINFATKPPGPLPGQSEGVGLSGLCQIVRGYTPPSIQANRCPDNADEVGRHHADVGPKPPAKHASHGCTEKA